MERKKTATLGLVVNPIAGMGGTVGLRGTDGDDALLKARKMGASQLSPKRAVFAMRELRRKVGTNLTVVTGASSMGADEARSCGFTPIVVGHPRRGRTKSADTKEAVSAMLEAEPALILFAGGDGTARDVFDVVGQDVPILGIPTGVKMHSAVFAVNPVEAGHVAAAFLAGRAKTRRSEIMDIDEEAFAHDKLSAKLYGFALSPYVERMVQDAKASSPTSDYQDAWEIAGGIVRSMEKDHLYIIGPGTTAKRIEDFLGLESSLLGVDVILNRKLVVANANESLLLRVMKGRETSIIVSPVGGQGFIFGRGNQPISARVIKSAKKNIIVTATPRKLAELQDKPLLVDTGDQKLDSSLRGYIRVLTGGSSFAIRKIS